MNNISSFENARLKKEIKAECELEAQLLPYQTIVRNIELELASALRTLYKKEVELFGEDRASERRVQRYIDKNNL